jgi:hypothetical protein
MCSATAAHIFAIGTRIYIKIGPGRQKELLMVEPNRFASAGGDVAIQLRPDREDNRIVLDHVRDPGGEAPMRFASITRAGRGGVD